MIVTKIAGGLGNQLFQYAYGRALATRNDAEFKIDITPFKTFKLFPYSLSRFNVQMNHATDNELKPFLACRPRPGKLGRILNPFLHDPKRYVLEGDFCFQPGKMNLKDPCYLDGYWLSEKYFLDIEDILRKEFTLREPMGSYSRSVAEKIIAVENPVSLHIRRYDRVIDPYTNKLFGTTSPHYYEMAKKIVRENVKNPVYFVITDDLEWARDNVHTGFPTEFIGQGQDKCHEDLELMRMCKHHILANSTFGWWGSWLSTHYRDGITVAPKFWNSKFDSEDLLPAHWTVLDL